MNERFSIEEEKFNWKLVSVLIRNWFLVFFYAAICNAISWNYWILCIIEYQFLRIFIFWIIIQFSDTFLWGTLKFLNLFTYTEASQQICFSEMDFEHFEFKVNTT